MLRPARGLRWALLALAAVSAVVAVSDPADARARRKRNFTSYKPPYAALVVDANTGKVLHATNPDSLRHPASLTKIMTLYLLFEQIEAGKLKLDSQLEVSEHASQQAPSKLGLRPGQTISVEDAIKALVTKSANDVAAIVAEAIGGDEETFARLMTRKARMLGMTRTVYTNASGLPDTEQLTTARDQALLGRAIQDRFPRFYRYFATPSFTYRRSAMRNHNRLLGRVVGIDGIKTGYTRASGFNLVSSLRRGNRHIVAVVLGGVSGGARDARMRSLLEEYIAEAATQRTVAKIVEPPAAPVQARVTEPAPARVAETPATTAAFAAKVEPTPHKRIETTPIPAIAAPKTALPSRPTRPAPGSSDPIQPVQVKTITVKAGPVQTAALAGLVAPTPQASLAPPNLAAPMPADPTPVATLPPAQKPGVLGTLPSPATEPTQFKVATATTTPATAPAPAQRVLPRGTWIVQVGAFPKEDEAKERLREAQTMAKRLLARADPFTERITKGNQELYRARFAVVDQETAEAACKYFKRNDIACMALKN